MEDVKARIQQWIKLIANDDQKAFRGFYDFYYARLFRWAFYFLPNDLLCEEIVSDVFVKLYHNRKRLVFIEDIENYLYTAVKHQSISYLRKNKKFRADSIENSLIIEYTEPDASILNKELNREIELAIASLPDRCQLIFRLVKEEGLSYKKVSDILSISPKTVENQMVVALKRLRNILIKLDPAKSSKK